VLPACADIVKTTLGESYSKELQDIPFEDNTKEEYRVFQKVFVNT